MHYKWSKELVGVPYDTITQRAKLHCRDLWHRQHCKGSLQCFVKNFNQFVDATISTKQKVNMTIHCDYCDKDFDESKYHEHLQGCKEFQEQPTNDALLERLGLFKKGNGNE
jgi:hypothetical protein